MSNDIAIQSTFRVPEGSTISTKPAHLIILKEKVGVAKNSHNQCFVSLEQPGMGNAAFVHAKGFFTDATPEEVKTTTRSFWLIWTRQPYQRSISTGTTSNASQTSYSGTNEPGSGHNQAYQ